MASSIVKSTCLFAFLCLVCLMPSAIRGQESGFESLSENEQSEIVDLIDEIIRRGGKPIDVLRSGVATLPVANNNRQGIDGINDAVSGSFLEHNHPPNYRQSSPSGSEYDHEDNDDDNLVDDASEDSEEEGEDEKKAGELGQNLSGLEQVVEPQSEETVPREPRVDTPHSDASSNISTPNLPPVELTVPSQPIVAPISAQHTEESEFLGPKGSQAPLGAKLRGQHPFTRQEEFTETKVTTSNANGTSHDHHHHHHRSQTSSSSSSTSSFAETMPQLANQMNLEMSAATNQPTKGTTASASTISAAPSKPLSDQSTGAWSTPNGGEEDYDETYMDSSDPLHPKEVRVSGKVRTSAGPNGSSHEEHHSHTSSSIGNDPNSFSRHSKSSYSSSSSSSSSKSSPMHGFRVSAIQRRRRQNKRIQQLKNRARTNPPALAPQVPLMPLPVIPYGVPLAAAGSWPGSFGPGAFAGPQAGDFAGAYNGMSPRAVSKRLQRQAKRMQAAQNLHGGQAF